MYHETNLVLQKTRTSQNGSAKNSGTSGGDAKTENMESREI